MDATEVLNQDHVAIEALFRRYEDLTPPHPSQKTALFREIREELERHRTIEEEIFYPAVREVRTPQAERLVRQAIEGQREIQLLLVELAGGNPASDAFDAKFQALKESVLRHAQEEETDLFTEVWGSISDDDLERLGQELADRKQELGRRVRRPPRPATGVERAVSRANRGRSTTAGRDSRSSRSPSRAPKSRTRTKSR
jgi:hypothetical protein